MSNVRSWSAPMALALALGCGGGAAGDGDAGVQDARAMTDVVTADDSGLGADATRDDGGSVGEDARPRDDAPSEARVTLRDVAVYANCMPAVPEDPIIAFWTADVTGATGSTATLVEARLAIVGRRAIVQNLLVDDPVIELSGGSGSGMQRKTGADVNPDGPCDDLCGGATAVLDLAYDTAGGRVLAHHESSFTCVF